MRFTFGAPTLLEPGSVPGADELLHDWPREISDRLAKIKGFAVWLKAEMEQNGIATKGFDLDGDRWVFEVPSDEGFVMCFVSNFGDEETRISLLVTEIGGAAEGVDHAAEGLLRRSGKVTGLKASQ